MYTGIYIPPYISIGLHIFPSSGKWLKKTGWGTCVYLWWIHVDIWQNQYNIVKLKNKIKKIKFQIYMQIKTKI